MQRLTGVGMGQPGSPGRLCDNAKMHTTWLFVDTREALPARAVLPDGEPQRRFSVNSLAKHAPPNVSLR